MGFRFIALLLIVNALFSTQSFAEEPKVEEARNSYEQGARYYLSRDWPLAVQHFLQSFELIENSNTAYMLSVSYMQWQKPRKTLEYANYSETLQPRLSPSLRGEVQKILKWANEYIAYESQFEASGKADGFFEGQAQADMKGPPRIPSTELPQSPLSTNRYTADKSTLNGEYIIQQRSSGRYLDAHEYDKKDYSLVTRPKQNNDTQVWIFRKYGPGVYTIQQKSNGRYVDAHEYEKLDYTLVTRPKQNNDTQRWIVRPTGDNYYTIQQKSNGRYVDAHESDTQDFRVVTRTQQANTTQSWRILRP